MSSARYLPHTSLQGIFAALAADGYRTIGPKARHGALVYEEMREAAELPWGVALDQRPGASRLVAGPEQRCFAWANGPQALKPLLFAPHEPLWQIRRTPEGFVVDPLLPDAARIAVLGVRACDLAALSIQDRHFLQGPHPDPQYGARRQDLLLIAVNCTHPAETCFCASTGDGPEAKEHFDLALTEGDGGFVVEAGSAAGERLLARLSLPEASSAQIEAAAGELRSAAAGQTRNLPSTNLRDALMAKLEHPRWQEVAQRCLSCSNCTLVCPTCFCHAETEAASLDGSSLHGREWDSCFGERHAYIHGKQLRPEIHQRYRQWLIHKLATWHDQFDRSGCVGCGRCIAWCPVGIDITEETAALLA